MPISMVHRNRKAHWDGKPRTATSTFTQFLSSEGDDQLFVVKYTTITEEIILLLFKD